ncbi:MAG: DNA starvation/stationary phase protection protein Dps [Henriciella sp.]|nr:DNA starvation/stationary phase protection protein Dps [Henriciella sp.]
MYTTRLGLADNARKTSIALLQAVLIDTLELRLTVKQAHWTVRGPRFQQLHELFDSFVAPLDQEIDEIAERIATLGGIPDGRSGSIAASTHLQAYELDTRAGHAHLIALADRFATLGDTVRSSIDAADQAGDADTADLLTATSRFLDKSVWFLEAHLSVEGDELE